MVDDSYLGFDLYFVQYIENAFTKISSTMNGVFA